MTRRELDALVRIAKTLKPIYYLPGLTTRQQNAIRNLQLITSKIYKRHDNKKGTLRGTEDAEP